MAWGKLKRLFGSQGGAGSNGGNGGAPQLEWIPAARNPWGVDVLDIGPVTQTMLAVSRDRRCAENAVSYGRDDGTSFIGMAPPSSRVIDIELRYPIDRYLADGPLFLPRVMEHKWALFHHAGTIYFVRSWRRHVTATARVRTQSGEAIIDRVVGDLPANGDSPTDTSMTVDFLIRTHALREPFPAPVLAAEADQPNQLALKCFSLFGNLVRFATPHEVHRRPPRRPLRAHSLLHIAVASGDVERAEKQLARGVPIDLLAADGLAPLHWSLAQADGRITTWLLDRGAPVDTLSDQGATALMSAVQGRSPQQVELLLSRGANPNARDLRGFTALHRAAETGESAIAGRLLEAGADPNAEADGHTPASLAEGRGHHEIVTLLMAQS